MQDVNTVPDALKRPLGFDWLFDLAAMLESDMDVLQKLTKGTP